MKNNMLRRSLILFVLLLVCVGCDQSTKYTARHFLEGGQTLSFMGNGFRLHYTENSGAFLSLGASMPGKIKKTIFVGLIAIGLSGFSLFVIGSRTLDNFAVACCALIIGGGIGNLIDRIINQGAVIDFMSVGIGSIRSGIFNVADVAIMTGAFMLVVLGVRRKPDQESPSGL